MVIKTNESYFLARKKALQKHAGDRNKLSFAGISNKNHLKSHISEFRKKINELLESDQSDKPSDDHESSEDDAAQDGVDGCAQSQGGNHD